MILALETSCDDTCAAVVSEDGRIVSSVIASQGLLHARYGGVVPEIASRHHLELVDAVTADHTAVWVDLDGGRGRTLLHCSDGVEILPPAS